MALTVNQLQMLEEEVEFWIDDERMFTAFEISKALKVKGIGLRHRELKQNIHDAVADYAGDGYTRTLADVGAPQKAWVYHPADSDPDDYQALDRTPAPGNNSQRTTSSNPGPTFAQSSSTSFASQSTPTDAYSSDSNGSLKIPRSDLQQLNIESNEKVHVLAEPMSQTITLGTPFEVDAVGAEVIQTNASGGLVLTQELLEEADLEGTARFKVEIVGQSIRIREYR